MDLSGGEVCSSAGLLLVLLPLMSVLASTDLALFRGGNEPLLEEDAGWFRPLWDCWDRLDRWGEILDWCFLACCCARDGDLTVATGPWLKKWGERTGEGGGGGGGGGGEGTENQYELIWGVSYYDARVMSLAWDYHSLSSQPMRASGITNINTYRLQKYWLLALYRGTPLERAVIRYHSHSNWGAVQYQLWRPTAQQIEQ